MIHQHSAGGNINSVSKAIAITIMTKDSSPNHLKSKWKSLIQSFFFSFFGRWEGRKSNDDDEEWKKRTHAEITNDDERPSEKGENMYGFFVSHIAARYGWIPKKMASSAFTIGRRTWTPRCL